MTPICLEGFICLLNEYQIKNTNRKSTQMEQRKKNYRVQMSIKIFCNHLICYMQEQ